MKVGCYVTVDDGGNYVTFHGLNVGIKIKTITKAQLDSVSNRELKRGLNRTAVLFFFSFVGDYIQTSADDVPQMMSSSANYRPFLSSFRLIPPQESFVKLAN